MALNDNPDDTVVANDAAEVSDENVITGTAGDDVLTGTSGPDRILGAEGDDQLRGRGGDDYLVGDGGGVGTVSGSDLLFGGAGDDIMFGDFEDTSLPAGRGDVMYGGSGNDQMHGGIGENWMRGGSGDDVMTSAPDAAGWMYGGAGNDMIQASGGEFHLFGGAGDDTLDARGMGSGEVGGGAGNDTILGPLQATGERILSGGAGNDVIVSRRTGDVVQGDSGDDRIEASESDSLSHIDGGGGTDTLDLHGYLTIDLTDPANQVVQAIEVLDLSGPAPAPPGFVNTVRLDEQTVTTFSGEEDTLRIDGDAGDTVNAVGAWQNAGVELIGTTSYAVYTLNDATLLVHPDLDFMLF